MSRWLVIFQGGPLAGHDAEAVTTREVEHPTLPVRVTSIPSGLRPDLDVPTGVGRYERVPNGDGNPPLYRWMTHAPWRCEEDGCDFAGSTGEAVGHHAVTGHDVGMWVG